MGDSILINCEQKTLENQYNSDFYTAIMNYIEELFSANRYINLVSRKITRDSLLKLLDESSILAKYVSCDFVVDAGSGNGILGVPIALLDKKKNVVLVEPQGKKSRFLKSVKRNLNINNLEVDERGIEEFLTIRREREITLVTRGFPNFSIFGSYLLNGVLKEALIITSENKIKKYQKHLVNLKQKTYNLPLRKYLKILKLEKIKK